MDLSVTTPLPASDQFLKSLTESGLLTPAEIRQITKAQAGPRDARQLAQELVKQRKLTRYQATELLNGRGKGLVLDNYVLLEELGEGGMGRVYKARHRGLKQIVALKVLSGDPTRKQTAIKRFDREVRMAAKLNHPHIVAARDAGEVKGIPFLVMDFVEGQDLAQHVKESGPLSVEQAVDYIIQAARGLAHAHQAGITHRDIKPGNLLLDSEGTVKVLDLGLARFEKNTSGNETTVDGLTKTGSIMGTCDFMAPEQALNIKAADHRADIYSLGCTLYFLVTGKPLYSGETAMEKVFAHQENPIPKLPGASRSLQTVFQRMVAKQPETRFQAVTEMITALEACSGKRKSRKGALLILGGGACAAAALLLAVVAILPSRNASPAIVNNGNVPDQAQKATQGTPAIMGGKFAAEPVPDRRMEAQPMPAPPQFKWKASVATRIQGPELRLEQNPAHDKARMGALQKLNDQLKQEQQKAEEAKRQPQPAPQP